MLHEYVLVLLGSVCDNAFILRPQLFVGNLNTAVVSEDELRRIFMRFGVVRDVSIRPKFASVQFGTASEALKAKSQQRRSSQRVRFCFVCLH